MIFSAILLAVGVAAKPPRAVSRRSGCIIRPTFFMASTTSSKGITLVIPASAISLHSTALTAPMALRLRQGHSTSPATGSPPTPKRVDCTAYISLYAWNFDKSGYRIAHKPQKIF